MDRINILYCSYRTWSNSILEYAMTFLENEYPNIDIHVKRISTKEDVLTEDLRQYDLLFFIGWSDIIPQSIIDSNTCICLHPSRLPKYRGGSPIQNQIMNGDYDSAITFFIMDNGIDTGDILYQVDLDLRGELNEIFNKITNKSYPILAQIILDFRNNKKLIGTPQNSIDATFFKRRTKNMSEIQISDFESYTATQLYDKIRSLQDPYPNAYIRCKDDTILYITKAKI